MYVDLHCSLCIHVNNVGSRLLQNSHNNMHEHKHHEEHKEENEQADDVTGDEKSETCLCNCEKCEECEGMQK